jgi:hypothetical protein
MVGIVFTFAKGFFVLLGVVVIVMLIATLIVKVKQNRADDRASLEDLNIVDSSSIDITDN